MEIRGNLHCLIKNYLEDRAQFVNNNGHSSRAQLITIGVPQGSILGPLFYTCFINNFSNFFLITIFHTLREDSAHRKKYEGLIMSLNNKLHKASTSLDANKLSVFFFCLRTIKIFLPPNKN